MRSQAAQLLRFCAVGLTCYVASMALFTALCELVRIHYIAAYIVTFLFANLLGFCLNWKFTFAGRGKFDRPAFVRYLLVNVGLLAANLLVLRLLVEKFHVWYLGATMIVAVANTPISFIAHRTVSYHIRLLNQLGRPATSDRRA
jgi:putative flippase GtrA